MTLATIRPTIRVDATQPFPSLVFVVHLGDLENRAENESRPKTHVVQGSLVLQ